MLKTQEVRPFRTAPPIIGEPHVLRQSFETGVGAHAGGRRDEQHHRLAPALFGRGQQPGLIAPTGLEIGKDGAFYVTNFGASAGNGQVLRIAAVPEPGTWAMMIAGFGLVGAAMRRRQRFTLRYLQRSPS